MDRLPTPPDTFVEFCPRFPKLGEAWALAGEAGRDGPLDEKTRLLIKLAVSLGAIREGAVHSAVRKAVAVGATREEIEQVIALAASPLGFPGAVAVDSWVRDVLAEDTTAG
jgi:alkylhydroperoxidase/carboxymuconolactone decarboxylase family protein YurZ